MGLAPVVVGVVNVVENLLTGQTAQVNEALQNAIQQAHDDQDNVTQQQQAAPQQQQAAGQPQGATQPQAPAQPQGSSPGSNQGNNNQAQTNASASQPAANPQQSAAPATQGPASPAETGTPAVQSAAGTGSGGGAIDHAAVSATGVAAGLAGQAAAAAVGTAGQIAGAALAATGSAVTARGADAQAAGRGTTAPITPGVMQPVTSATSAPNATLPRATEQALVPLGVASGPPPEPASQGAVAESLVARRSAAIAAAFRLGGELEASRELRARTRDLSPALAGEVVVAARPTIERIVASTHGAQAGGDRVGAVAPVQRWDGAPMAQPGVLAEQARQAQVGANLAGTVAHVVRDASGEGLARSMATLILEAEVRAEYRLSSYSLGIPFGTGLPLPLALAEELDRRGDQRRRCQLLMDMEQGLRRLGERIAATVNGLLALTLPLMEALDTEASGGEAIERLQAYTEQHADFLGEFAAMMARLDPLGGDAILALDSLSRREPLPQELRGARDHLVGDAKTAFAIGQSAAAQDFVLERATRGEGQRDEDAPTVEIEAVQRVYAGLGFSRPRAALLAQVTCTAQSVVMMETRWAAAQAKADLHESARAFETLLRFVGGRARRPLRAVELADVDRVAESGPAGWGLYLSLEQAA